MSVGEIGKRKIRKKKKQITNFTIVEKKKIQKIKARN